MVVEAVKRAARCAPGVPVADAGEAVAIPCRHVSLLVPRVSPGAPVSPVRPPPGPISQAAKEDIDRLVCFSRSRWHIFVEMSGQEKLLIV